MPDKNPKGGADKPGEVAEETFLERWSRLKTSGGSPEGRADSPADAPVAAEPDAAGPAGGPGQAALWVACSPVSPPGLAARNRYSGCSRVNG